MKEEEEDGNREIAATKARISEFVAHSDKVREQMKQNMIAKEKEMAAVALLADVSTNSSIKAKAVNATIFDWAAKKKQQMKRYESAVKRQVDYFKADTNDKIADIKPTVDGLADAILDDIGDAVDRFLEPNKIIKAKRQNGYALATREIGRASCRERV